MVSGPSPPNNVWRLPCRTAHPPVAIPIPDWPPESRSGDNTERTATVSRHAEPAPIDRRSAGVESAKEDKHQNKNEHKDKATDAELHVGPGA